MRLSGHHDESDELLEMSSGGSKLVVKRQCCAHDSHADQLVEFRERSTEGGFFHSLRTQESSEGAFDSCDGDGMLAGALDAR